MIKGRAALPGGDEQPPGDANWLLSILVNSGFKVNMIGWKLNG